ncbi:bacteriophage N4 adsorption protein B [Geobacter sp. OR-1]|uniref:chemotaxis protein CheX n=1 Tax=Geobacter sp. OR-1 TaxID=1266765 RepID=UPI000542A266|nr:chemotaxis protein CheX [Geobacter sp. OR-1]GAM09955.1 bacteriophage N4 adsorption protein B [Geobacter sp. OR-1]
MAVKFFGQFLVEQGAISREALLKAIELQESVNKSIGDIAIEMGLMTQADVEQVNLAQRSEDLRFGDLAVKMGFLTSEALQKALQKQSESHLYIGKAIVMTGGLDAEQIDQYLAAFKADQSLYATDRVLLPSELKHQPLWEMMADLSYKMLTRVARLTFRPVPCEIVKRLEDFHIIAAMDFTGDVRCRYVFSASEEVQTQVAKAILSQEEVSHEPKEVLDDTVMEFINVVCGNIAAKSVQQGIALDILPPELLTSEGGIDIPAGYTGLNFPICLADGKASITIIIYP